MKKFIIGFLLVGVSAVFGSTIYVSGPTEITNPVGGGESTNIVNWSQLGKNDAAVSESFSATSTAGTVVYGSLSGASGGTVLDACSTVACSVAPGGGVAANDALVSTTDSDGPMTLTFGSTAGVANGIYGAGAYVDASAGMLEFAVYSGTSILTEGFFTSDGTDPLFLGAMDTSASITKIVVTMFGAGNFALDSLYVSSPTFTTTTTTTTKTTQTPVGAAPEPAMFPLMGVALAGLYLIAKNRSVRA